MKKKNVWKRFLGFMLAMCLVCSAGFSNFSLGLVKAQNASNTVNHQVPANVSRYQVEYTGQHLTMLCNSTPVNWTESKTVYFTYKVVSYTAGTALQGYCGTNTPSNAYPYSLGMGLMTRNESLLPTGEESKSEVLKPGYTYYVAFDVTDEGMTVRAERVKDGVTETVHYDKVWGTNVGTDPVDCSTLNYFGLYLGGASGAGYTATLTDVSIYDASGNDYGVQCPRFAVLNGGTVTQLRPPLNHEIPENVSRYQVDYTGQHLTLLSNSTPVNWSESKTVYLTYKVVSYTAGTALQGYCGTNTPSNAYPYSLGMGLMTRNESLLPTGEESKSEVLKPGYTYYVAFDVTDEGMTVRAERVKDGVTETVHYDKVWGTNEGTDPVDCSTLDYFGLYLGGSSGNGYTASLTNVSIYDADGNDYGVQCPRFAVLNGGTVTQLRAPLNHEVPENISRYNVSYKQNSLTTIYNKKQINWTTSTSIYLTYKVDSYTAGHNLQGYCATNKVDSYPYDLGTGMVTRNNTLMSAGQESTTEVLKPGYTYYVVFDVTNEGLTIRADRVKDGVTEFVSYDRLFGTNVGTDPLDYSTLQYFGLYLGEAAYTAELSNVSIYDANGNDLGVTGYNISVNEVEKPREPLNHEIPQDVVGYNISYKGQQLSFLCNRDPVDWLTHTTLYLTYTVDAYSGQDGNQGYAGTSDFKATWPYGGNPDLGAMEYNKAGETENILMLEGYTYFMAFDITDSGMSCRVDRVKDGVTETINLPSKNTLDTGAWTSLVYFGLWLDASTVAELSNVSIYDESGNDLGVRNSQDVTIYLSSLDINVENDVLTIAGSGSVTASMVNEYLEEQQIEKDTIKEIHVENNISVVSANAFNGFTSLEKVYYAKSVVNVSERAFENCASNVVIGCAPGTCFVGGLKNATVVHCLDIEAIGEQTSYEGGTLELHLVPSGAVNGILNETRYSGLSAQIDTDELQPITLKKTDSGTVSVVLRNLDKDNFTLTIPKGIAKTAEPINGVSGFEISDDIIIYVSGDVITMKPMVGVNVHATVEEEGKVKTDASTGAIVGAGFYFNTVPSEDSMPVGGNGTNANIYSMAGNDNGVFINGEKTSAFLRKIEENRYYVSLSDAGYSVRGGDVVTISGAFEYKGTPISFAPISVKYTAESSNEEGIWEIVSSGTIVVGETVVDRGLDPSINYIVEGKDVKVLYPNTQQAVSVSDKTVLFKAGKYVVSRKLGNVTFQKSVVIKQNENIGNVDIPQIVGATGAGQYSGNYISNVGATENGTVVMSITDGSNTTYQTNTKYDDYGLDYVLDFDFDREIKVLQLTDTQIIDSTQMRYADRLYAESITKYQPENMENLVFSYMREAIKAAQPDLILLTGDNIYGEFDDKGTSLQALIAELDSYQIPWAPIFGNHDNESAMGVEWQCEQLMNSEYCLFNRRHSIGGNGNYSIGLSKDGELQRVVYMMDSNFCFAAPAEEYANGNLITKQGFTDAQIAWYRSLQLRVNQVAEETIPSFLCCHIPDIGIMEGAIWAGYQSGEDSSGLVYTIGADVTAQLGDSGYKGGAFGDCLDTAMLPYMNEVGTDGIFFGHQHNINTSIYYSGVRFTFGLKTGEYDSHPNQLGGTLISLKRNTQTGESFVINQIVVN